EPPVGELVARQGLIVLVVGIVGAVGLEVARDVGLAVFARQSLAPDQQALDPQREVLRTLQDLAQTGVVADFLPGTPSQVRHAGGETGEKPSTRNLRLHHRCRRLPDGYRSAR